MLKRITLLLLIVGLCLSAYADKVTDYTTESSPTGSYYVHIFKTNSGSDRKTTIGNIISTNASAIAVSANCVTSDYTWTHLTVTSNLEFGANYGGFSGIGLKLSYDGTGVLDRGLLIEANDSGNSHVSLEVSDNATSGGINTGARFTMNRATDYAVNVISGLTILQETSTYATLNVTTIANFTAISTPSAVTGNMFLNALDSKAYMYDGSTWQAFW